MRRGPRCRRVHGSLPRCGDGRTRSRSGEGGARTSASTTRGRHDAGSRDAPNRGIGPSTLWAAQDVSLGTFFAEIGATLVLPPEVVKRQRQGCNVKGPRDGNLGARAGSIEGPACTLVEPALVEALHHGEHLAGEAAAALLLGREIRAKEKRQAPRGPPRGPRA